MELFDRRRQRHAEASLFVQHLPPARRGIHWQLLESGFLRKIEGVILPGRFRVQPQPPSLVEVPGVGYARARERRKDDWKGDAGDAERIHQQAQFD